MNRQILQSIHSFVSCVLSPLILLLIPTIASAESIQSKDWKWNVDRDDYFFALTINKSDHIFGQYCYIESATCYYLVATKTSCEKDTEMPALINSDQGAIHVTLVCKHEYVGGNVMIVEPFDDIDLVVRESSYFRLALPMEGDQFKVVRFSLVGSTYAVDLMRAATEKVVEILKTKQAPDEEYL